MSTARRRLKTPQQILAAVEQIDRPGTFATSGKLPTVLPGLEVDGVGPVPMPLDKHLAAALRKQARQAPYGKGEKTLVDTKVRRVWEIDADRVALTNPEWDGVVARAIERAQADLGLQGQQVESHLYKLLLYERGSFFLPHRDGEKLDRMVATLVIALPGVHEGGALIVRHEGREHVVNFDEGSAFHTQFAAFYADCEHEVQPVQSGHRLALVYNLTLAKSRRTIKAPTSAHHITALSDLLDRWKADCLAVGRDREAPSKLAILLDHQYTQAGLSADTLKGVDRARANILFEAAQRSGCDAYLALVTLWEYGSGGPADPFIGRSRYGRWRDADDEDDGDYVMEDVVDTSLTAEHLSDADGRPFDFAQLPVDEGEIIARQRLGAGEPQRQDFEGFTGNAGMTLERWYHSAAIVLWPAEFRLDIFCEAGADAAVDRLRTMVKESQNAATRDRPDRRAECATFASKLMDHWPAKAFNYHFHRRDETGVVLLRQLDVLDDPRLIARWIRQLLARDAAVDPGRLLGKLCRKHGWATFRDDLLALYQATDAVTIACRTRLLADWSTRRDRDTDRKALCTELAGLCFAAWQRAAEDGANTSFRRNPADRAPVLAELTQTLIATDDAARLDSLVDYVLHRPETFDLTEVQIPALWSLTKWLQRAVKPPCPPLFRWLSAVHAELAARVATPPTEPNDWRRDAGFPCSCPDCRLLKHFLQDPDMPTFRLAVAQPRRQHLHQIIDRHRLDLNHETERRGRPYTLVCSKTQATYQRELQRHETYLEHMDNINAMLDWHGPCATQDDATA